MSIKRLRLTPNSSFQSIRGAVLAAGLLGHGVDGQRCLLQLKPDSLAARRETHGQLWPGGLKRG